MPLPQGDNPEERLSRIFAALGTPAVRHLVELLALGPRSEAELRLHFDLPPGELASNANLLTDLGLASPFFRQRLSLQDYGFNDEGLKLIQAWLDRIKSRQIRP